MPPFAGTMLPPTSDVLPANNKKKSCPPNIVTINVGGQFFQTTPQTLSLAGPKSLLSTLAVDDGGGRIIPFLDRDPDLFSALLSLLRTGRLPSAAFDLDDLLSEARFYGLHSLLLSSLSDPSQFDPFDLRVSAVLSLNGRDSPSAVAATPFGTIHVAHGGKITSFDWSLRRKSTVLTCFPAVDSLLAISPSAVAAGATDFAGLQIVDLRNGSVEKTLDWAAGNAIASSTVQGIGASPELLFGSFESCRRNASAIVAFDLAGGTFRPVAEIQRGEIYGAEIDAAIPATKLRWVPGPNLMMAAGSHAAPAGIHGNIRLWDVRSSGAAVWEITETSDCFADVAVSDELNAIFKIGVDSGEVFMADLRKLGDSWICVGDGGKRRARSGGRREGSGCSVESHGNHVFCTRGGDVEMWSEVVVMGGGRSTGRWSGGGGEEEGVRVMRKNAMGRRKGMEGKITGMVFGGNRMVLTRRDQQCVEVWESSAR